MTASFAGAPEHTLNIGDIVEGAEAVRYMNAGYAEAVHEERNMETATLRKSKAAK